MIINFSPMRSDEQISISVSGETLILNGVEYDLSPAQDGAPLLAETLKWDWLASDVTRQNGVLHFTLFLPHGPNAPENVLYPAPVTVTEDGPVPLPTDLG